MEFSGTFDLEDADVEEVWLALSDPAMVQHALRGCKFIVRVDDEDPDFDALREAHADETPDLTADPAVIEDRAFEGGGTYAALVEADVGSVSPSFETVVTVDERDEPRMAASGEGSAGNSSFEMRSSMELSESDDGVTVDWEAEADVFGRLAQMGQRMINPVAKRMTRQFFQNLQDQLRDLQVGDADTATGSDEDLSRDGGPAAGKGAVEETTRDAGDGTETESTDGVETERRGGIVARIKRLLRID